MEKRAERAFAWSGIAFCVVWGIGMALLARFVPPTAPSLDAQAVAALYAESRNWIRTGAVVMFVGNGFYLSFTAIISLVIWRAGYRLWATLQLLGGGLGAMAPFIATMFWTAAAFRPDRDPQIVQALSDIGWLFAIMFTIPVLLQYVSVGMVGLTAAPDRAPWPRWVGFLSVWLAVAQQPAPLLTYFHTGPFAWDGLFAFWIPAIAFFGWILIMVPTLLRAIRVQATASVDPPPLTGI